MVSNFRLRFFSSDLRARFSAFLGVLSSCQGATLAGRSLHRVLTVGALAVALLFGTIGSYAQPAQAAQTNAYESGPVRPSRNPISGENFQGGVEPSVLDQKGNPANSPEGQTEGFLESAKDKVKEVLPGTSPDSKELSDQAAAGVNTQKNPTLKRYGADAQ
jgi:hypothetical protein